MIKDAAEYNSYNSAIGQPTPRAKEQAMENFLQQYPKSVVKQQILEMLIDAYLQTGDTDKALATARTLLQIDPNDLRALAVSVYILRAQASHLTNPMDARPLLEEAAKNAQTGLNAQAPSGPDAANFYKLKAEATPIFNGAIASHDSIAAASPALSQRMAHNVVTTTPDSALKTIPLTDKEFVLYYGTPDDAKKVWQTMKGLTTKVSGKVISVTADSVELAVGDGAQRSTIADFTIRMKKSSTQPPAIGSAVSYIATFDSYNQNPFMITMKVDNPHSTGLSGALTLGAIGVGAAAGLQKNPVYAQQQLAQVQAEINAYQQAAIQRYVQQQAATSAAMGSDMSPGYGSTGPTPASTYSAGSSAMSNLPPGCGWPSDFDQIRDSEMLSVLRNENFAQQLQAGGAPISQQMVQSEQVLSQVQATLGPTEETIRAISSPTVTHYDFKFNYDQTCKGGGAKDALLAAECQHVNILNAMYAMNGTLQIMDCMAGSPVRASIGPPQDTATPEDEVPSTPRVAEVPQPTSAPAPATPQPSGQGSCHPQPGDTVCR